VNVWEGNFWQIGLMGAPTQLPVTIERKLQGSPLPRRPLCPCGWKGPGPCCPPWPRGLRPDNRGQGWVASRAGLGLNTEGGPCPAANTSPGYQLASSIGRASAPSKGGQLGPHSWLILAVGLGGQLGTLGGGPSPSHGVVGEALPSGPYIQEVPATWAGAGPDMRNEGGDYVQPLGEGGCHQILKMNLIGIFCRLNLEVKMEILIIFSTLRILEMMGELVMVTMMKRALEIVMV
jgi:hypothetical protein